MNILVLKKTLIDELIKDFSCTFTIPNKLYIKIYFLINIFLKAKLSLKSISRFGKKYKKIKIKAKRLKKI